MDIKFKVKIDVFRSEVTIVVCDDINKTITKYYRKIGWKIEEDYGCDGLTLSSEKYNMVTILFDKGCIDSEVITHETHHAVTEIAKSCGIDDEETEAYLQGYLVKQINKRLAKEAEKLIK